ncbi:MAG: alkaline phosphatase family protein [Candidatus Methylomirabilales bacterium]
MKLDYQAGFMAARLICLTLFTILSIIGGTCPLVAQPLVRRVVVVSIDGARPDGLLQAKTPTITRLWKRGAYSFRAQTIFPSTTLPSHTSMLTGLTPDRHGMWKNSWEPGQPTVAVETVFSLAASHGLKTAMVVAKGKLAFLTRPGSPHLVKVISAPAPKVAAWAARYLASEQPELLFVHFADADWTGHRHGWMTPAYLEALELADQGVEILLRALEQTGLVHETLFILTADHGGHGRIHGTARPEDMTIPWIAFGPGAREGYEIQEAIVTTDTAATILDALNLPIPEGWDGRPLRSIFR